MASSSNPKRQKVQQKSLRTSWLGNAMKSIGASSVNVIQKMTPNLTDFTTAGVETAKSVVPLVRGNKGNGKRVQTALMGNKYVRTARTALKNSLEDIKQGNFNNTQRASKAMLGDDSADNYFDSGGFSFGDDGSEDINVNMDTSDVAQSNFMISEQIGRQSEMQAKTAKANLDAMISVSSAKMVQTQQLGESIIDNLNSINQNISNLVSYNNETFSKYIEASMAFYEKIGSKVEKNAGATISGDKELTAADVLNSKSTGGINLAKYKKYVKQQLSNAGGTVSSLSMINEMLSDDVLESLASNPLGMMSEGIVRLAMPLALKNTITGIEKSFSTFIPALGAKVAEWSDIVGNDMMSNIKRWVGNTFGLRVKDTNSINLGASIKKGAVDFDGITRHTIVELIPNELRQQTAYLKAIASGNRISGRSDIMKEMKAFDFNKGEYVSIDSINRNIVDTITNEIVSQMRNGIFGNAIEQRALAIEDEGERERFNSTMDQLLVAISRLDKSIELRKNNKDLIKLIRSTGADTGTVNNILDTFESMTETERSGVEGAKINARNGKANIIRQISENPQEYNLFQSSLDLSDINAAIDAEFKRRGLSGKSASLSGAKERKNRIYAVNSFDETTKNPFAKYFKNSKYNEETATKISSGVSDQLKSTGKHVEDAMSALYHGSPKEAVQHLTAIFGDAGKSVFGAIKTGFIDPLSKSIFGEKNDKGYNKGGLFSSAKNRMLDMAKEARRLITGQGYEDSKGEKHEFYEGSLFGKLSETGKFVKDSIFDTFKSIKESTVDKLFGGKENVKGGVKKAGTLIDNIIDTFKDGLEGWKVALFGSSDSTEKDRQEALDRAKEYIHDNVPNALMGAVAGAGIGQLSGGLLGSLVGGPVVGAVLGSAIGFAKNSQKFQEFVFGRELENGTHVGGFINDRLRNWFKDNKKALVGGAVLGGATSIITGSSGGVLGTLVGGPIAGALLGMATGAVVKSKAWQRFIFGDEDKGQRGVKQILSNAWNKVRTDIGGSDLKDGRGKGSASRLFGMAAIGGAGGALSGALLGKVGILGASLSPLGPIGGALIGLGGAIIAQKNNLHDWLFGTKDRDEYGQRKDPGVLGRFGNMMQAYIFRPAARGVESMIEQAAIYIEHDVLFNAKQILEKSLYPIVESAGIIKEQVSEAFKQGRAFISENFINPFFDILRDTVLKPINSIGSFVGKVAFKAVMSSITTPLKMINALMTPIAHITKAMNTKLIPAITLFAKKVSSIGRMLSGGLKFILKGLSLPGKILGAGLGALTTKIDERVLKKQREKDAEGNPYSGFDNTQRREKKLNAQEKKSKLAEAREKYRARKDKSYNEQLLNKYAPGMFLEDTIENRERVERISGKEGKIKWRGEATVLPKIAQKKNEDLLVTDPTKLTYEERQTVALNKISDRMVDLADDVSDIADDVRRKNRRKKGKGKNRTTEDGIKEKIDENNQAEEKEKQAEEAKKANQGSLQDVMQHGMEQYGFFNYLKMMASPKYLKDKYNTTSYFRALYQAVTNPIYEKEQQDLRVGSIFKNIDLTDGKTEEPQKESLFKNINLGGEGSGYPYFSQNDPRWKNRPYGGFGPTMGTSGCGPTALAMALSKVTGRNITPTELADFAVGSGSRDKSGTNWNFINKASGAYGIGSNQYIFPTKNFLSSAIGHGPVILSGRYGGYGDEEDDEETGIFGKIFGFVKNKVSKLFKKKKDKKEGEETTEDSSKQIIVVNNNQPEAGATISDKQTNAQRVQAEAKKRYEEAVDKGYTADERHKKVQEEAEKRKEEREKAQLATMEASVREQKNTRIGLGSLISNIFSKKGFIGFLLLRNWQTVKGVIESVTEALPTIKEKIEGIYGWYNENVKPIVNKIGEILGVRGSKHQEDKEYGNDNLDGNRSPEEQAGYIADHKVQTLTDAITDSGNIHNIPKMAKAVPTIVTGAGKAAAGAGKVYMKWRHPIAYKGYKYVKKSVKSSIGRYKDISIKNAASSVTVDFNTGDIYDAATGELLQKGGANTATVAAKEGTENVLEKAGKKATKEVVDEATTLADDASDSGLFNKAIDLVKRGLAFIIEKCGLTGKFKKLGEFTSKITGFMRTIKSKLIVKLTQIFGKQGLNAILIGAPMAIAGLNAALSGAEKLFRVNSDAVTPLMRTIAASFAALSEAPGLGAVLSILEVVDEFYSAMNGASFLSTFAYAIYSALASDEDVEKLDAAQQAFKDEYDSYKNTTLQTEYSAYLTSRGLTSSDMSFDEYNTKVQNGELTSDVMGFSEYNNKQHKTLLGSAQDAIIGGVTGIGTGIATGAKNAGAFLFGGESTETYYDQNTGITYTKIDKNNYQMSRDGISLGTISSDNVDTSNMANLTKKEKNVLGKIGAFFTGDSAYEYVDEEAAKSVNQSASIVKAEAQSTSLANSKYALNAFNTVDEENQYLWSGLADAYTWNDKDVSENNRVYDDTTVWYTAYGCFYMRNKDGNYDLVNLNGSIIEGQTITPQELEMLKVGNVVVEGTSENNTYATKAINEINKYNTNYWKNVQKSIQNRNTSSNTQINPFNFNLNSSSGTTTSSSTPLSGSEAATVLLNGGSIGGFGDSLNGHAYYSQNDPRWSDIPYTTIGKGGCGPTAMAMAMKDITGRNVSPNQMASYAQAMGDRDQTGTNWKFVSDVAGAYGIGTSQIVTPSSYALSRALESGRPVVLSGVSGGFGRSPYTKAGHYVVAVGKDSNGNVIINDPRGRSYSGRYKLDDVARETGSAWTFGGFGKRIIRGGRGILDTIGEVMSNIGSRMFEGLATGVYNTDITSFQQPVQTGSTSYTSTPTSSGTYNKLVMFGDSRTHGMAIAFGASGNGDVYTSGNTIFIAKDSQGYDWFNSTAAGLGKSYIDANTAVVIWFGVNDTGNASKYASLVNTLAKEWGCKVFYMSPTPGDLTSRASLNTSVESFNSTLKSSLDPSIGWIDAYSYVKGKMQSGEYSTVDGLHYNNTTYKGIYDYMISNVGTISGGSGKGRIRGKIRSIKNRILGGGFGESLNGFSYYSQNDPSWKNTDYSGYMRDGATIGDTGCGPAAMSMVASQLTGQDITPVEMSNYAVASGTRDYTGTNWNFIDSAANAYGIQSRRLSPSTRSINSELDRGNPVILSGVSSGNGRSAYTNAGHYVVAVGRDNSGNIIVNDPRGRSYSGKYSANKLMRETGSAWSFGRGGSGNVESSGISTKKDSTTIKAEKEQKKQLTKEQEAREAVVGWILCIANQNTYTMGSQRTQVGDGLHGHGYGDCSSTQQWVFQTALGINIGDYTGAQIANGNGEIIEKYPIGTGACPSESILLPGDLLYFGSGEAGGNSHVEMYVGNNSLIGHSSGTNGGKGPQVKVMTDYAPKSHNGTTYVIRFINSKTINSININKPDPANYKIPNTFTDGKGSSGNGSNVGGTVGTSNSSATVGSMSLLDKISTITSMAPTKLFEGLATGNYDTDINSWFSSTTSTTTPTSTNTTTLGTGTTLTGDSDAAKVQNYFKGKGLTSAGVAGLMGNLEAESGIRFNNLENSCEAGGKYDLGGYNDDSYTAAVDNGTISKERFLHPRDGQQFGYGLAQWTSPDRKAGLYDLVKSRNVSISDPQSQCDWLWEELNNSYQGVLNVLKTTNSVQEASDKVLMDFEQPGDAASKSAERLSMSQKYFTGGAGTGRKSNANIPSLNIRRYSISGGMGEEETAPSADIRTSGYIDTQSQTTRTTYNTRNVVVRDNSKTEKLLQEIIELLGNISDNTFTTADKLEYLRQSASNGTTTTNQTTTRATKSSSGVPGRSNERNKSIAKRIALG